MPISGTPSGSCRSNATPAIRRALATTGTLSTEIGNSMFYSKVKFLVLTTKLYMAGPIKQLHSSRTSLDSQSAMKENENLDSSESRLTAVSSRFPKLQECAHFHYDRVELGQIQVMFMYEGPTAATSALGNQNEEPASSKGNVCGLGEEIAQTRDFFMTLSVSSNGKTFLIRRTYRNLRKFDRQLHKCVHDRQLSGLAELPKLDFDTVSAEHLERLKADVVAYLARFSQLTGNFINCAPVLSWLELDNRGYRLVASDDSAINTPAVAACKVVKRYVQQASDELNLEVGDMISVIDCGVDSMWWRGKKELDVGFFPCDCVEVIGASGDGAPSIGPTNRAPVLRRRGKLISFLRSFLSSRPSRRRLKESGILKERVYGCDLGEHLLNTGQKIPVVLVHCATYLEEHGTVDGIYRLSGISSNIQKLRLEFDAEKVPNLLDDVFVQDIHSVASVLKLYFRELPNPLLTYQLYDLFVQAVQSADETRLLKIHDVVSKLPPPHFRTLEFLMRHLARIASSSNKTGMNSKNLAIVWAPNLLRSSEAESGVEALRGVSVCAIAVEYLIQNADLIFSNRLQSSSLVTRNGFSAKHNRPKSLAVSTPTKLLSLHEARALNRTNLDTAFIEVGAGPENMPKYHTIIDIPSRNKRRSNNKSPSTWRNLFASKNRKQSWSRSPLDLQHPLTALDNGSPSSGCVQRRKLAQSTKSLSTSQKPTFPDFPRPLNGNESSLLRTPVLLRRSQNAAHNRSLSHDSYFDEIIDNSLPQTVIDVVHTVPCSMTECGLLVQLSLGEILEADDESGLKSQSVSEKRRNGRFSFGRDKSKPAPVTALSVVPVVVRVDHPNGRRKMNRTLSPEFLRKHRPISSLKRSLSASPNAGHHPADWISNSTTSSPITRRRTDSSGRKSFRRSTSDDDLVILPAADHTSLSNALAASIMDLSQQDEARTFESTEMELFDEICAEIYGKDTVRESPVQPMNEEQTCIHDRAARNSSLQDITEICEEEGSSKSLRPSSFPLATMLVHNDTGSLVVGSDHRELENKLNSSSSLGLYSLFAIPTECVTTVTSSYFFNGDSNPTVSSEETPVVELATAATASFTPAEPSVTYYFGQSDPLPSSSITSNQSTIVGNVKTEVSQLRAIYFGLNAPGLGDDLDQLGAFSDQLATKDGVANNLQSDMADELVRDALSRNSTESARIETAFESCLDRPSSCVELNVNSAILDLESSHQPSDHNLSDGNSMEYEEEAYSSQRNVPCLVQAEGLQVPDMTDITAVAYLDEPKTSVLAATAKVDGAQQITSGALEYLILLHKAMHPAIVPDSTPVPTSAIPESPPSVRQLRNRFESSLTAETSPDIPEADAVSAAATIQADVGRPETLKEKLHALSDMYRDASPPVTPQGTTSVDAKLKLHPNDGVTVPTKVFTRDKSCSSPVLPEKPRHLRGVTVVPIVQRRGSSADKVSESGSLTSLTSTGSCVSIGKGAMPPATVEEDVLTTITASKVSQMRRIELSREYRAALSIAAAEKSGFLCLFVLRVRDVLFEAILK
ncbi:Rho GTPase-activating protein 32 [Hypsibius exemplaris]|uniref:Rho GTPase-activating protein 32 n=1 Tax=Hypsibius exemplaris TaxID=2072580 RepID=A0A1W0X8G4_HYPEX|nr:Rho GTPase-activating protein 32 [Hypsibius exemplaris]